MEIIHEKEATINSIQKENENYKINLNFKDNRIVELETELLTVKQSIESLEGNLSHLHKKTETYLNRDDIELIKLAENRGKEIERLEEELRKRTGNLQEIVNKELWDKNREIEQLQKRIRSNDIFSGAGDAKIQLTKNDNLLRLKTELNDLNQKYELCLRSKQEALDLCGILTTRLEELALFLKSLLKQHVLGFLGIFLFIYYI